MGMQLLVQRASVCRVVVMNMLDASLDDLIKSKAGGGGGGAIRKGRGNGKARATPYAAPHNRNPRGTGGSKQFISNDGGDETTDGQLRAEAHARRGVGRGEPGSATR